MPELPFIEVLTENLGPRLVGRTIGRVHLASPSVLKTFEPPLDQVRGRTIEAVRRVGKLIILDLDDGLSIVFHLMRNGRMQVRPAARAPRPSKDVALVMSLDDGFALRFVEIGPKKRAALYVTATEGMVDRDPLEGLGVDTLSHLFTPDRLRNSLAADAGQLKHFLTLQRYITGIGNTFSDEILWEAQLSPFVLTTKLATADIARLYQAVRGTLHRALEEHRREFGKELPVKEPLHLLRVHRHAGEPCPRCGTKIAQIAFAEKETYYCPTCQTGGKVYADRRLSRLLR